MIIIDAVLILNIFYSYLISLMLFDNYIQKMHINNVCNETFYLKDPKSNWRIPYTVNHSLL